MSNIRNLNNNYIKERSLYLIGLRLFQTGVLFLAGAPAISFFLLFLSSFFGGLIGYDLRNIGQQHNHIWVLSIIALYAGFDWISKSLND